MHEFHKARLKRIDIETSVRHAAHEHILLKLCALSEFKFGLNVVDKHNLRQLSSDIDITYLRHI